jgi:hypothetical protein
MQIAYRLDGAGIVMREGLPAQSAHWVTDGDIHQECGLALRIAIHGDFALS